MTTTPRPATATVGPYRLLAPLGEGGMGVVHLAQGPDGHRVALKVLRPHVVGDAEARARLAREVETLRRVSSPRVAEIVDADPEGPMPYVVTRYVPGLSLYHHVEEEGVLTGRDLHHAMACLADALRAVHAVGVLHRDIKPTNVLMEGRAPVLIDFGLARLADDTRLTQAGWLMGTPGYLAPEILYGDPALPASDVHAWAATLVYGATGRPPYGTGPTMAVLDRVRRGEHDLSGVPEPERGLLTACLAPEPADRPTLTEITGWLAEHEPGGPHGGAHGGDGPRGTNGAGAPAALWTMPFQAAEADDAPTPTPDPTPTPAPVEPPTAAQPAYRETTPREEPPPFRSEPPATTVLPATGPAPSGVSPASPGDDRAGESRPAAGVPWERVPETPPSRVQRVLQVAGLGALTAGLVAYAPYLGTALVAVVVLLLRTASVTRQRHDRRRRLRGRTAWYDVPASVLASPVHLLRASGGTVVGVMMAGLVGLAAFSVGYLADRPVATSLLLAGVGFAPTLWWGPGSRRLRETTHTMVDATARTAWGGWLVAVLAVLAAAVLVSALLGPGPTWSPDVGPPWR